MNRFSSSECHRLYRQRRQVPGTSPPKEERFSVFFCWKVEPPRDGRIFRGGSSRPGPSLPCFVLGTTTEPPPPCHFAQQRQQRAMPPLCVAVHNRLSCGRNAVARLRCTPLLPPKDRISYHPMIAGARLRKLHIRLFHGAPLSCKNIPSHNSRTFSAPLHVTLKDSLSTPLLSDRGKKRH